ncbi:MAG: hypothetical protein J0H88_16400 [Sphingomonadales bacterium]|mgnify:CR=1 FL=1|nr:hypothetical protein [Sphingomonadales bacterium]
MSGDKRHAPTGHSLFDHPCHGLFTGQIVGELSHRAYIGDGPIYCERCGTELDKNKNRKKGAPLHWEPRTDNSVRRNFEFQPQVQPWLLACFGPEIAGDREERNHRFLEEALELVQACGCSASEAHQLVDYVFGRPIGEPRQEAGGVMVTLAALCLANALDMHKAGWDELQRIWTKVEQIRAKQAAKPKHGPLPEVRREADEAARAQTMERLRILAKQRTSSEMDEDEREGADWHGAYDWFCHESRAIFAALSAAPADDAGQYLVWSNEHRGWWGPDRRGYTQFAERAGRYGRDEALRIAGVARGGWMTGKNPSEIAIPEADALPQSLHPDRLEAWLNRRPGSDDGV